MKKLLLSFLTISSLLFFQTTQGQNYDYLKSATATGNGITTNNSTDWSNLFSVEIDVTNVSHVLVTASINMHPHSISTNADSRGPTIIFTELILLLTKVA